MSEPVEEENALHRRPGMRLAVLWLLFVAAGLALYRPALEGPPIRTAAA